MMFRGNDDHLHPSLTQYSDPLLRVKSYRIEQLRRFITVTPFHTREGVYGKVDECCHLKLLPGKLTRMGYDPRCHGLLDTVGRVYRKFNLPRIKFVVIIICT
jgi:hypothetical protein